MFQEIYKYYLFTLILYLIIYYVYYISTKFQKTITIKDNRIMNINKQVYNFVIDTNDDVYVIDNRYALLHFDAVNVMTNIENNKTYLVSGYGVRIPFLELYPNILKIK